MEQHTPPHNKSVWAYGRWWSFAEIGREVGISRVAVRERWKRCESAEEIFGDKGLPPERPDADGSWRLGVSIRKWGQIIAYANRESPEAAAGVYGVPVGAVEAAIRGDEWSLD